MVTLRFDDYSEFQAFGDPDNNWINRMYCYPSFGGNSLTFEVEAYKITCRRITVESVERPPEEDTDTEDK
jgi:hypothetical protein